MQHIFKLFLFSIIMISTTINSYAETNDEKFKKEVKSFIKLQPELYPVSIGVYGGGFFPENDAKGAGVGGGAGVRIKYNFNKFLGIASDFGYTFSQGKPKTESVTNIFFNNASKMDTHIFDIRILLMLQYETKKNDKGFSPWLGIGPVISIANYREETYSYFTDKIEYNTTGASFGFIAGFGLRYNFKKFYTGLNCDYTIVSPADINLSAIRLNLEAGYRF